MAAVLLVLDELVSAERLTKRRLADETVVIAVYLARALGPGGPRNRQAERRMSAAQLGDDRPLADAGGSADQY